ncbi:MAG: Jag N-terminal domain-containing protein, partial [Oscillospiraceae bacterium]|nr:Jag N-terminal domain-containing protein [Oscillospiraceae bacterium]
MTKFIEVTGKTEEEAIASALAELELSRDEVSVEILERAKSGFLGIGASPARVRVSYEVVDTQRDKVERYLRGLLDAMGVEAQIDITER